MAEHPARVPEAGSQIGISEEEIASRIDRMARRDRLIALIFITALWLVLTFVYVVATTMAPGSGVIVALTIAFLILGIVNTASILALIKRYGQEKDHVYRDDILNLERNRRKPTAEGG